MSSVKATSSRSWRAEVAAAEQQPVPSAGRTAAPEKAPSGPGARSGPVRDLVLEPDHGERESGLDSEYAVLHELVKAARARLKPGTWDYLIGGAETETTFRRNRLALDELAFRPRVLRDVSRVDPSGRLLGIPLRIPVVLAPIGSLQDFDPGGGATTARAAIDYGVVRMLELLEHEIRVCLGLLGVNGYGELDETWLHRGARVVAEPHATSAFPLLAEGY